MLFHKVTFLPYKVNNPHLNSQNCFAVEDKWLIASELLYFSLLDFKQRGSAYFVVNQSVGLHGARVAEGLLQREQRRGKGAREDAEGEGLPAAAR
ncbi:MAG: hypothetical protein IK045_06370, partial [Bacteroidales bacterium]|nr:hypothetical protein [Bacteroidales bacterium]